MITIQPEDQQAADKSQPTVGQSDGMNKRLIKTTSKITTKIPTKTNTQTVISVTEESNRFKDLFGFVINKVIRA